MYTPSQYILDSKKEKYEGLYGKREDNKGITLEGREQGMRHLMAVNLMKRMESSVYAFRLTIERIRDIVSQTIGDIIDYEKGIKTSSLSLTDISDTEFDSEDQNNDIFTIGRKVKIDIADMDYPSWKRYLERDREVLDLLVDMISDITPEHDSKLQTLLNTIEDKQINPINPGNKKIIIFTAFADTADYLFENVSMYAKEKIGEMANESKSNINAMKENFKIFSEKAKGKASSELLKAQMNIDVAKEELQAKKEAHDKASLEKYIEEVTEYASACVELSLLATEEAKLATLEMVSAQQEYDEKYGNEE